jgi:hypothetical protein
VNASKATCILSMAFIALSGCGRDSGQSAVPKQQPVEPKLIHSPPITRLTPEQLRALSMECEKYSPDKSTRGPYDAAYCEDAIAAWADSPLQMVPIPKDEGIAHPPAPP